MRSAPDDVRRLASPKNDRLILHDLVDDVVFLMVQQSEGRGRKLLARAMSEGWKRIPPDHRMAERFVSSNKRSRLTLVHDLPTDTVWSMTKQSKKRGRELLGLAATDGWWTVPSGDSVPSPRECIIEEVVSHPIVATSDDAALFELLAQVGGRMPTDV